MDVVVKVVDLRSNSYRDLEHRGRSLRSYRVETGFYHTFANRLQQACQRYFCQWIQRPLHLTTCLLQVEARVPKLLHHHWQANDDGLVIVLEDLRPRTGNELSQRLTNQALGLDFAQVGLAAIWAPHVISCRHWCCMKCRTQHLLQNLMSPLWCLQAALALRWLSRMHAACWGCPPAGIWPQVTCLCMLAACDLHLS